MCGDGKQAYHPAGDTPNEPDAVYAEYLRRMKEKEKEKVQEE